MNNRIRSRILPISLGLLCLAGLASASTAVIGPDVLGTPLLVYAVTASATAGGPGVGFPATQTMVGLQVTVTFQGGATSTAVFAAGCGDACGSASAAAGAGAWTLTESKDTGAVQDFTQIDTTPNNFWTLTNTTGQAIQSVDLVGGVVTNGNVIFDRNRALGGASGVAVPVGSVQFGTPNSAIGVTFTTLTTSTTPPSPPPADSGNFAVTFTYSNIVKFFASNPACQGATFAGLTAGTTGCGDEFQKLNFTFTNAGFFAGSVATPGVFHFFQDTDNVGTPEPVTSGLIGAGLLAVFVYRRRRIAGQAS